MAKATKQPARKLRRDAAENRARLIASGRIVLAERGLEATLDDVAHHAGVGVGTAYRHFPNKQALASEVLEEAIAELAADVERALAEPDPWQAFAGFFETVVDRQSRNRGLHLISAHDGIASEHTRQQLTDAVTRLFQRARAAGVIRADAHPTDIGPILIMMRTLIDTSTPPLPKLWRRYLAFILDGLRATDRPAAPVRALTRHEFDLFVANRAKQGK